VIRSVIGVIGCGNMGGAVVRGLIWKRIADPGAILLIDKDKEKSKALSLETGASFCELEQILSASDIIFLAVKPQESDGVLKNLAAGIGGKTVISIMAGVPMDSITAGLGQEIPVARAMPNMAAFVSESMTAISYNRLVDDKKEIKEIFEGIGKVIEVEEGLMNAVTALSGSGPAYLFYLAEALIRAGIKMGLTPDKADELVRQTLYGSSAFLSGGKIGPEELIAKVASKGGTTEAALKVFDDEGLKDVIKKAVLKAEERSMEISGG